MNFIQKVFAVYEGSEFEMGFIGNLFACLIIGIITAAVIIGIPLLCITLFKSKFGKDEV